MILVTGASGFLGTHLVAALRRTGFCVVTLDYAPQVNITSDSWAADLTRSDHIAQLINAQAKPETIIHLAGYIDIALKPNPSGAHLPPVPGDENIPLLYAINVGATAHIVQYAQACNVSRIIFASTQAVYGMPDEVLTETTPCKPLEYYAASKLSAEQLLGVALSNRLQTVSVRFPGLYCQCRNRGVVYQFCLSALEQKHITVACEYPLPIDVIHVDDVVRALIAMLSVRDLPAVLNIATGKPCNLDLTADMIAGAVSGCTVAHAAVQQPLVCMDASRARKAIGWEARPVEYHINALLESIQNAQDQSLNSYCS